MRCRLTLPEGPRRARVFRPCSRVVIRHCTTTKNTSTLVRLLLAALLVLAAQKLSTAGLRVTWSGSIPRGIYWGLDRPVERGHIVIFCLPRDVGRWARGRGYLDAGKCPGGSSPLGKPVIALAGHRVTVTSERILVDGRSLKRSQRSWTDSAGRPMPWAPEGEHLLQPGELWLHSAYHSRSLDSRVFGPVRVEAVREILVPILTEAP